MDASGSTPVSLVKADIDTDIDIDGDNDNDLQVILNPLQPAPTPPSEPREPAPAPAPAPAARSATVVPAPSTSSSHAVISGRGRPTNSSSSSSYPPPSLPPTSTGSTSDPPDLSRDDILRQIFGDVGELIGDFSCAVESTVLLHGRMYITNRFACFYSNLFGLEKKIRIPYSHITLITKENTALVFPNAMAITTHRKEYLFRSFWDRDECYKLVQELIYRHRQSQSQLNSQSTFIISDRSSLIDSTQPVANATSHSHNNGNGANQAQHRNSIPPPSSNSNTINANNRTPQSMRGRSHSHSSSVGTPTTSTISAVTTASHPVIVALTEVTIADDGLETETDMDLNASTSNANTNDPVIVGNSIDADNNNNTLGNNRGFSHGISNGRHVGSTASLLAECDAEIAKSKLKLLATSGILPNTTIGEFVALFIDDNAPFPLKAFHESVGDSALVVSPWSAGGGTGAYMYRSRDLRFIKPIPTIRSQTRGVKVQRYRCFGDVALVVAASTRLEDVPAADAFSVEDLMVVKQAGDHLSVELFLEVKFVKSTMMRYMIEHGTIPEARKWLEQLLVRYQTVCATPNLRSQATLTSQNQLTTSATVTASATAASSVALHGDTSATIIATTDTIVASAPIRARKDSNQQEGTSINSHNNNSVTKRTKRTVLSLFSLNSVGGRCFWASWAVCVAVFLWMGYQSYGSKARSAEVARQLADVQRSLAAVIASQQRIDATLARLLEREREREHAGTKSTDESDHLLSELSQLQRNANSVIDAHVSHVGEWKH